MRRFFLFSFTGLLAAVFCVGFLLLFLSARAARLMPWPKRLDYVRLAPARPILRAEDITPANAFYFIRMLTNCVPKFEFEERRQMDQTGWKDGVYTNLEKWLVECQPCFDLCSRAASMTNCQVITSDSISTINAPVSDVLALMKGYGVRMQRDMVHNDWDSFTRNARECLVLSSHLSRGGSLIDRLVSVAGTEIAASTIRQAASERRMPSRVARDMDDILRDCAENAEPLAEVMRYEWLSAKSAMQIVYSESDQNIVAQLAAFQPGDAAGNSRQSHWFSHVIAPFVRILGSSPRNTMAHAEAVFSHLIDSADDSRKARQICDQVENLARGDSSRGLLFFFNDPIGRILVGLLVPSLENAVDRHLSYRVSLQASRVVLALRQFQYVNDRIPESLAELVPAYLDEIPADAFRPASNLIYRADNDRWLVYSVGPDGEDDGGRLNWMDFEVRKVASNVLDVVFASDEASARREKNSKKL